MLQKVILFSEFSEMCRILYRELSQYKPALIIGEINDENRQKELLRFKTDNNCQLLISSSAGQYGLNLTEANVVINYDLPFSLAKLEQRIGRAHRMGQKKTVSVYSLLGKGTADMAIKRIIHGKTKLSQDLLGNTPIGMQDIKDMLEEEPF